MTDDCKADENDKLHEKSTYTQENNSFEIILYMLAWDHYRQYPQAVAKLNSTKFSGLYLLQEKHHLFLLNIIKAPHLPSSSMVAWMRVRAPVCLSTLYFSPALISDPFTLQVITGRGKPSASHRITTSLPLLAIRVGLGPS